MQFGITHAIRVLLLWWLAAEAAGQAADFDIARYELAMRLHLDEKGIFAPRNSLTATARITFRNTSDASVSSIPLLLYRLFHVTAVRSGEGAELRFAERVTGLEEWDTYQANVVTVELDPPAGPASTHTVELDYSGAMVGIEESGMLYVRDALDPDFTIIRAETSAYPHLAEPTRAGLMRRMAGGDRFDQEVTVVAPKGLVVASGMQLIGQDHSEKATSWRFASREPSFQIILAIGAYATLESGPVRVYYFQEDKAGAERIAGGIGAAMALYEAWFGSLCDRSTFAVVEIPEWYGSQSLRPTVLQDARAFRSEDALPELYHEISHFWNVPDPDSRPSRWNEGLAMYLQEVTWHRLHRSNRSLGDTWESARQDLAKRLEDHPEFRDIPLERAGEREVTSVLSYRGGQLMFALLHDLLGEERLIGLMREYYQTHCRTAVSSREFARYLVDRAPDAAAIVAEWFTGSTYSRLLLDGLDFAALAQRYGSDAGDAR